MAKHRVTIESTDIVTNEGKRPDGSRWMTREQEAFLHVDGKKYPRNCLIRLEDNDKPFPAGEYETDAHLVIGDYQRLRVSFDLGLQRVSGK